MQPSVSNTNTHTDMLADYLKKTKGKRGTSLCQKGIIFFSYSQLPEVQKTMSKIAIEASLDNSQLFRRDRSNTRVTKLFLDRLYSMKKKLRFISLIYIYFFS